MQADKNILFVEFFIGVYICLFVMDIHCNSKWIQSHADNLLFKWIMQFSCWFVGQKPMFAWKTVK